MSGKRCETCSFRAKYDNNPKSLLGKIWRWHANWCPGWKSYMNSLKKKKRTAIAKKYNMDKYL
ncbi:MAG: hypothetical protein ABIJ37_11085 [Pseudomonadota bacterium]